MTPYSDGTGDIYVMRGIGVDVRSSCF